MKPIINIKYTQGHFVVYVNHKFFCSADTFGEAVRELEKEGHI